MNIPLKNFFTKSADKRTIQGNLIFSTHSPVYAGPTPIIPAGKDKAQLLTTSFNKQV